MKFQTFSDRLLANCAVEIATFIGGLLAVAIANWLNNGSGNDFAAGFLDGVATCALISSVTSAIPKLKKIAQ
ncbi:hypothetical protein [Ralstonia insidiosa]|jgi:zinc transporter ZupT|nr:hypothetical protein [Ralstonia insidiosa]MBA9939264.1 hypothetical protein [Ralstonia insidiosa]MBC9968036.1 hypothetical protein [Ralstonia insidiosa]MBX3904401.1 hypothetical protein [Ralstonia insidiosa]